MKNNKLRTAMSLPIALAMSLSLVSCSDKVESKVVSTASAIVAPLSNQASIMSYIPADTPILMVYANDPKHPLPQNFKDKMNKLSDSIGDILKVSMTENMKMFADISGKEENSVEVSEFIDKWFNKEGFDKLGMVVGETETAFYMVDLFPVLRLNLAKSHSMGEVLDDLLIKANESKPDTAIKRDVNGKTIYQFGDKELQVMVNLDGNSFVASIAPPREVDSLMPKLLGFEKPSKSLKQSSQYNDTISKYNYVGNSLYWMNTRQLADYFVNPDQHKTAMLDIMKIQDNMLSADCKTEILQIIDKMPRMVGGNTLLDEHKMDSHMIIEMENGLGSKFATLSGRIPKANADAAMSYGFSFDISAAKTLAQEFVTNIEAVPYKCEFLQGMNEGVAGIKAKLDSPMPPFVGNFKGFNIILDELDLDFSKTEPSEMIKNLKAKVLLAVDNPDSLLGMAAMMMPEIQELGLKAGADAVNVSSLIPVKGTMMPINLDHVFMAMGTETLGVSLGEGTDKGLTTSVSSESINTLFDFKIEAKLYKNIFTGLSDMNLGMSEEVKKEFALQKMFMSDMLWWDSQAGTLDFTDRGFEINIDINY